LVQVFGADVDVERTASGRAVFPPHHASFGCCVGGGQSVALQIILLGAAVPWYKRNGELVRKSPKGVSQVDVPGIAALPSFCAVFL
jgi:hypothetical protein